MSTDERMQVVLGLMPADAVFIVRRGYVAGGRDTSKFPHDYSIVAEYPGSNRARLLHAGVDIGVWFYSEQEAIAAAWEHVQELGDDASEDDGVCVDPLLWAPKSNGYVSESNPWQAGLYTPADKDYRPRGEDPDAHSYTVSVQGYLVGAIQDDTPLAVLVDEIIRLRAALIERGHTDECYSGMIEECDCPLRVLGKLPKEQA